MATAEHTDDVVVLGAGPVGQTAAERARAGGLSVAVVERELVGGDCSYWAYRRADRAGGSPGPRDRRRNRRRGDGAKLNADGYTGRARILVDIDNGYLLGVTMGGPGVSEFIAFSHHRHSRSGPDRPAVARRAVLPDDQ